jgi:DNA sulfur modification protein DndD
MILQQLTLHNFCLFRGEQTFDLAPVTAHGRHRPIVLFGGINGGGKTTLLDAIQLALYGARARCSKRTSLSYEEFLRESVHHGSAPGERAGVTLSFRYATEGTEHLYEVCRTWSAEDGRLREELRVHRDGLHDSWLSDNWPQLVEELFPLDIAQLFFFDAEKIRSLAEDESSSRALEAAIKALLGLDVVERLIADSAVLQARLVKKLGTSQEQADASALEQQLQECQSQFQNLTTERASLENARLRAEQELKQAEERFAASGGSHWDARQRRAHQLAEVEGLAQEIEDELIDLAAGELPLALVTGLLDKVQEQDRQEQKAGEAAIIHWLLHERDEQLLKVLQGARASSRLVALVSNYLAADRQRREMALPSGPRHHLSEAGRSLLRSLCAHALPAAVERARQGLASWARATEERDDLERANAATPPEADIGALLEEVKAATRALALLNDQARRLDEVKETARGKLETAQDHLRLLSESQVLKDFAGEDARRMLDLAARTRDTMQAFLQQVTARKIDRLSSLITESFRFLLRKGGLVERIAIDPRAFAITLYDRDGRGVPKQRLSEGEKQIFAIAVLWGLARASARPLPAVIDTPMARLDAKHRHHLVERYFPNASHQVVIFSTDTEVDREHYGLLQASIARAYHLDYDEQARMTVGKQGYFWAA